MPAQLQIEYIPFYHFSELSKREQLLVHSAIEATSLSYDPYSNFKVVAAISTADSTIYQGDNQENAIYAITVCAERTALGVYASQAVKDEITHIAIAYNAQQI